MSALSFQFSVFSFQFSVVSCQLSVSVSASASASALSVVSTSIFMFAMPHAHHPPCSRGHQLSLQPPNESEHPPSPHESEPEPAEPPLPQPPTKAPLWPLSPSQLSRLHVEPALPLRAARGAPRPVTRRFLRSMQALKSSTSEPSYASLVHACSISVLTRSG